MAMFPKHVDKWKERTVTPDLRDLNFRLRSNDRRKWHALELGFDEESFRVVDRWQLLSGGDVSRFGRAGPFAAPVVSSVIGGVFGLSLAEAGSDDKD